MCEDNKLELELLLSFEALISECFSKKPGPILVKVGKKVAWVPRRRDCPSNANRGHTALLISREDVL